MRAWCPRAVALVPENKDSNTCIDCDWGLKNIQVAVGFQGMSTSLSKDRNLSGTQHSDVFVHCSLFLPSFQYAITLSLRLHLV